MEGRNIIVSITDTGRGIADIEKAMEPLYTGKPETERSGMGFTVMEAFMDSVSVQSVLNEGTTVTMEKQLRAHDTRDTLFSIAETKISEA